PADRAPQGSWIPRSGCRPGPGGCARRSSRAGRPRRSRSASDRTWPLAPWPRLAAGRDRCACPPGQGLAACTLDNEAPQQLEGADDVRDVDLLVLLVGVAAHAWAEVDGVQPLSAELGHRRPGLLGFDRQIAEPLQS